MKKLISVRLHGYLDYIVSTVLIASPWLFGYYRDGVETWLPVCLGGSTIIYSLFTKYDAGIFRKISMPWHLTLDLMGAILLGIAPWTFGFAEEVWVPHLIFGALETGVVVLTQPSTLRPTSVA